MHHPSQRHPKPDEAGVALVLTLGILAILVLLVVGFVVSMRTEQIAARNFTYVMAARNLAQGGVDEGIYMLRTNMPVIDASNYYVSLPGRALRTAPVFDNRLYSVFTPLSGAGTIDLNADRVVIYSNSTYDAASKRALYADWIPVGTDGANPAAGNPIIGRFAYWVDDEATKINVNSSGRRTGTTANDQLGAATTNIDLTVLNGVGPASWVNTYNYSTNVGYFTTDQWKDTSTVGSNVYLKNLAYITAFSADDNLTPWGTNRVDLNTAAFADIATALGGTASILSGFLPSQSFALKYGAVGVNQIAANIIDFRSPGIDATSDSQTAPTYCGLKPTPYLNEIIVNGDNTAPATVTISAQIELVNPYSPATIANDYTNIIEYTITDTASNLFPAPFSGTATLIYNVSVPAKGYPPTPLPSVILYQTNFPAPVAVSPIIQVTFNRIRLLNRNGKLVDFAVNLVDPPAAPMTIPLGGAIANSIEANDPRANDTMTHPVTGVALWSDGGATGTPGNQNAAMALGGITLATATDLTNDGSETAAATPLYLSTFYVKTNAFASTGELGFIHTGRPWRTLRMQQRGAGTDLPDWVALDIFTSTIGRTNSARQVLGRINLNGKFDTVRGNIMSRGEPIQALFEGNTNIVSSSQTSALVQNITNVNFAATYTPPVTFLSPTNFNLIGEICEIQNLADQVATTASDVKSNRESRVASIANLVTARSNQFTIWAIGQSIQKVDLTDPANYRPDLGDQIVGEAKAQAVVERYVDSGQVKFRTLYFRYVTE